MDKKGLAAGLVLIMIALFIFAIMTLFVTFAWNQFNNAVQNADNTTIQPDVKEKVASTGNIVNWGDKIFIALFVVLMVAYIISSVTIPTDKPIFFLVFAFFLVIITILAMVLSNTWAVFSEYPDFVSAAAQLKFIDYFMHYYPIIILFVGIVGGVLFYGRRRIGGQDFGGTNTVQEWD